MTPDPTPDPLAICRAAQLVPLAPPVLDRGGWNVYVARRPGEATLRRRLHAAGAVLVRYGTTVDAGSERLYVRFLLMPDPASPPVNPPLTATEEG